MRMNAVVVVMVLFCARPVVAQSTVMFAWHPESGGDAGIAARDLSDHQDDPGYAVYKEGYNLILDERWDDARKKLSELLSRYPGSHYADDAAYWTAYALKKTNRKKAIDAYTKFMKVYAKSGYYDDAVADLAELKNGRSKVIERLTVKGNAHVYMTDEWVFLGDGEEKLHVGEGDVIIGEGPESLVVDQRGITISGDGRSFHYSYGDAPKVQSLERAFKIHSSRLQNIRLQAGTPAAPARGGNAGEGEKIDPKTRVRMEALLSLGESVEDEKSFRTLRGIVLDGNQPPPLRRVALRTLSGFKKYDVVPVYAEVVRNDTSEEMQFFAIDAITRREKDRNKTASVLISVFKTIPDTRTEQRQLLFYSIADIGSDRAIDFLSDVARTNKDYELRREAIYYLGNIGGAKARNALFEILKDN